MNNSTVKDFSKSLKQITQTFTRHILGMLTQIVTVLILANLLGAEGQGQYALASTLSYFLGNFLSLSITISNVYFLNSLAIHFSTIFSLNLKIWAMTSVIGILVSSIAIFGWGHELFPKIPISLLVIAMLIFPVMTLQGYLVSLLQAKHEFTKYNFISISTSISNLLCLVPLLLIWQKSALAALLAFGLSQILTLIITIVFILPFFKHSSKPSSVHKTVTLRVFLDYSFKSHISSVIAFLNNRINLFIINLFLNPEHIGVYNIALQITEKIWIIPEAISAVLFPKLAQLHGEQTNSTSLTIFSTRWILIIATLGSLCLILCIYYLLPIVLSADFAGVLSLSLWLIPGIILGAPARIIGNDISARGYPGLNSQVAVAVLIINITAHITLTPIWGLLGAAIATSLARILTFIWRIFIYRRLTGMQWHDILLPNEWDQRLLSSLRSKWKSS